MTDSFHTIKENSTFSIYKEKGSKFIGYAYPIENVTDIEIILESLKKEHGKARHWCYAWRVGNLHNQKYKINDDGEPSGSAGLPIYGQIQSKDLTNVLVVVVRYFGGTKLGVGGLITAYKTAAHDILEMSEIIEKTIDDYFKLIFTYENMNKVLKIIKNSNAEIKKQEMDIQCQFHVSIRQKLSTEFVKNMEELRCVTIVKK